MHCNKCNNTSGWLTFTPTGFTLSQGFSEGHWYQPHDSWLWSATCQPVWGSGQESASPAETPRPPHNLPVWREGATINHLYSVKCEGAVRDSDKLCLSFFFLFHPSFIATFHEIEKSVQTVHTERERADIKVSNRNMWLKALHKVCTPSFESFQVWMAVRVKPSAHSFSFYSEDERKMWHSDKYGNCVCSDFGLWQ